MKSEIGDVDMILRAKSIFDRSRQESFSGEGVLLNRVQQKVDQESLKERFKKYAINLCLAMEKELLSELRDLVTHTDFELLRLPENYY